MLLDLGYIVEVSHDLLAGMELGGLIDGLFDLDDLLLIIHGLLGDGVCILILGHSDGDELLDDGTELLGTGLGSNELAVPEKSGRHIAEHSITLIGGLVELTVRHKFFLL